MEEIKIASNPYVSELNYQTMATCRTLLKKLYAVWKKPQTANALDPSPFMIDNKRISKIDTKVKGTIENKEDS